MASSQTIQKALVLGGVILCSICDGFIFGQMSGMLSDLQQNKEIDISEESISWIASIMNLCCIIGLFLASIISEIFGRKRAVTILTTPILINWIMLYFAKSATVIMLTRILVGTCFGGVMFLIYMVTAEYADPRTRGIFLSLINSVGPSLGTAVGHILGILFNWRTVALIGTVPTTLAVIIPFFWVESPSWLASKGKFEECKTSFRTLHGYGNRADEELKLLIELEQYKMKKISEKGQKVISGRIDKKLTAAIKESYFWKIVLLLTVIAAYRTAAGKFLFSTFAISMVHEITESSNILYFTLLIDALLVLGSCLSCILINKMKMRTLLFCTGSLGNVLLLLLSLCLYFEPKNVFYFKWITCGLLGLYFIAVNCGPYPVLEASCAEIIPLEVKPYLLIYVGSMSAVAIFSSIKLATVMVDAMGYHGTFFLNSVIMLFCLVVLWKYLPETKSKTLQEIEICVTNNKLEMTNMRNLLHKEENVNS